MWAKINKAMYLTAKEKSAKDYGALMQMCYADSYLNKKVKDSCCKTNNATKLISSGVIVDISISICKRLPSD